MATPHDSVAFPVLSADQIDRLRPAGRERERADGEVLIGAESRGFHLDVVLDGHMDVVEDNTEARKLVTNHVPKEFSGDVDMLTGRPAVITGLANGPLRVLDPLAQRHDRLRVADASLRTPTPKRGRWGTCGQER